MNGDIVTRLRRWTHAVDAAPASDLMDEAADLITALRLEIRVMKLIPSQNAQNASGCPTGPQCDSLRQ